MIGLQRNILERILLLIRGYAGLSLAFHPDDPSSNLGKAKFLIFFPLSKTCFFFLKHNIIITIAYFMAIGHKNFLKVGKNSILAVSSSFLQNEPGKNEK